MRDAMQAARAAAAGGQLGSALQSASRALALSCDTAQRTDAARLFAALIAPAAPPGYHTQLDADLLTCLTAPDVEAQPLARVTAELLLLKHPGGPDLDTLAEDPLWLAFLTRCMNVHPVMEARLQALRTATLDGVPSPAICALAAQMHAGEHILPRSEAGRRRLPDSDDAATLLVRALYESLSVLTDRVPQAVRALRTMPEAQMLVRQALDEPSAERVMAAALPSLGGEDASSAAVRDQYERNPYPRWRAPPCPTRRSVSATIADLTGSAPRGPANILVAGCGTGYEAIDLARTDPGAKVTAIDLSRASLGYAARMARNLDAEIAFAQGDLLALPTDWANRFDLVTSTGVLHHLERPAAGLAALARVTRPGGALRIALYSERARVAVRAAHELIARRGFSPDPDGIRAFRAHVLAAPAGSPLAPLLGSDDFYSVSGCRDLCFHVREHRFTLPQIYDLVASNGLRVAGLDAPPEARRLYAAAFGPDTDPLDFTRWDRIETHYPHLFAGMYHFWLQRPV